MLVPSLFGGLFIGVLSALPFVNFANCCCLWVVSGGAISAWLLQQDEDEPIGSARGALVGLGAGAIGAFVWLVVTVVLDPIVVPFQRQVFESLAPNASDMPPQARDMLRSMADPDSAVARWLMGFFGQLFIGVIFAPLGGILGSVVVRPSRPPAGTPPPPVVPPPLPPSA